MAIFIAILIIALVSSFWVLSGRFSGSQTDNEGNLMSNLEQIKTIMWIGAHPDDEVYVAGLLAYASKVEKKKCVIVSFIYTPEKRSLNEESASYLGCEYVYLEKISGKTWEDKLRAVLLEYRPEIVITFDPANGFRGLKAHIIAAETTEKLIKKEFKNTKLYYVLNKDPILAQLLNGPQDPTTPTDELNLDISYPELGSTLWQAKLHVIAIYKYAVPACRKIADNVDNLQEKIIHKEFYAAADG